MHPYVVIPLLVCVGAAVLASAAIARDPRVRVNWLAGGALAISGLWAFLDVLLNSSPDRATALFWSRSMGFAYLFLAPICFDLVGELRPRLRQRSNNSWASSNCS